MLIVTTCVLVIEAGIMLVDVTSAIDVEVLVAGFVVNDVTVLITYDFAVLVTVWV